jgi:TonB family protein
MSLRSPYASHSPLSIRALIREESEDLSTSLRVIIASLEVLMRVALTVTALTFALSVLHFAGPRSVEAAQSQAPAMAMFARVYQSSTPGLTAPTPISKPSPPYTPEAMRMKVQGPVKLEITVDQDGRVRDAMVTQSLDAGMDEEAVKAASRWTFVPGRLNGQAVPVRMVLSFDLRLH